MILSLSIIYRVDLGVILDLLALWDQEDFQDHLGHLVLMALMAHLVNRDHQDNLVDLECLVFLEKKDLQELKEKREMLESQDILVQLGLEETEGVQEPLDFLGKKDRKENQ